MTSPGSYLVRELGISGEHADFTRDDWRRAVAEEETIAGYFEWCSLQVKNTQREFFDDQLGLFDGSGKDVIYA